MATALIDLNPRQKQRLARRGKKQGKSPSHEVSKAVDFYLTVPPATHKELTMVRAANQATDRMIKNLDQTIAHVDRVLQERRKSRK